MRNARSDAGFFTMDALGALLAFAFLLPALGMLWQHGAETLKKRVVAEHFVTVQRAAWEYGKMFYTTLLPQITATSGPTITFADMKASGCLPERFVDINAWGQSYQVTARRDTNGAMAMIVLTSGGREHSDTHPEFANITVPGTAALAKAGFIPTNLLGGGVIRGAYGGWEVSLASMGLDATSGHLGSISAFSTDDLAQDFLYRVEVPGRPELNAMQTSLDMTDHGINNVQTLSFVPHEEETVFAEFCTPDADGNMPDEGRTFLDADQGLYLCRDGRIVLVSDSGNTLPLQDAQLVINGQLLNKPICAAGTSLHPEIFVAPSSVSSGETSPVAASIQAWATDYSTEQWQVHLRVLNARNQWVYPDPEYGRMIAFATCARD
jgi:hypothetical protein